MRINYPRCDNEMDILFHEIERFYSEVEASALEKTPNGKNSKVLADENVVC